MPQFGDTLLLLAVVNLPVGDHVVQFVRQRLRFVPLAGGRHDRYGAEQQQGSQQVCGWSGPAAAGSVREQGKSTTFCRMPAFFLIFPICLTPQRHITRRKPKRRDAPDSGSDFRAKISFSRFKVQKIADIRNRTGKKKNPRRQNRRRFGRKSAGGRHGTGCVPGRNSQAMSVESYPSFITSSMPMSL